MMDKTLIARELKLAARDMQAGPVQLLPPAIRRDFAISDESKSERMNWKKALYNLMQNYAKGYALFYNKDNDLLAIAHHSDWGFGVRVLTTDPYFKKGWRLLQNYKQAARAYQSLSAYIDEDKMGKAIVVQLDRNVEKKRRERHLRKPVMSPETDQFIRVIGRWQKIARKAIRRSLMDGLADLDEMNTYAERPVSAKDFKESLEKAMKELRVNNFHIMLFGMPKDFERGLWNKYPEAISVLSGNALRDYAEGNRPDYLQRATKGTKDIKNYLKEFDDLVQKYVRSYKPSRQRALPASEWLTREQVAEICPQCSVRMARKGIKRIKSSVVMAAYKEAANWERGLRDHFGRKAKPTSKDVNRIYDIGDKAMKKVGYDERRNGFPMPEDMEDEMKAYEVTLAERMAKSIGHADKAYRRALAAEDINYHSVAKVFYDRAEELWKKMRVTASSREAGSTTHSTFIQDQNYDDRCWLIVRIHPLSESPSSIASDMTRVIKSAEGYLKKAGLDYTARGDWSAGDKSLHTSIWVHHSADETAEALKRYYGNLQRRKFASSDKEAAKWEKMPKGWTDESRKKFWNTLTGNSKHKVTACIKKMKGKFDDPGAFCASLADRVDPGWRSRKKARAWWKEEINEITGYIAGGNIEQASRQLDELANDFRTDRELKKFSQTLRRANNEIDKGNKIAAAVQEDLYGWEPPPIKR